MSAKTSTQPGRRTPLSLSGTLTKSHPTKSGNNGGNNANGHTASNSNKQDNKLQQQKNEQQTTNNSDTKENPNKKQQPQADKKQQQTDLKKSNEKNQNGTNSSNKPQQSSESKQVQQQNKDKQQQQNGKDNNKVNEKDKKENSDKLEKIEDKIEKEDTKLKEEKKVEQSSGKTENIKDEKKSKEAKDDKKEVATKIDEKTEPQKLVESVDKHSKEEYKVKSIDQKTEEKIEDMEVKEGEHSPQKPIPVTPKSNSKANKTSTPVNKTPTRVTEKTPQKSTPTNNSVKNTPVTKRVVTTAIDDDDIEMEPLAIESSPIKSRQEVAHINIAPSATSTPGKILLPKRNLAVPKSDVQLAMQTGMSTERPKVYSQISGRKSIRPISDYTPSKFQSNVQFRESYRRINTELDATNTSMNVTVGSEVPNNLSFSFFGRGRKRDRTPPQHSQSAIGELQTDMEISPPKRARLDMHSFFTVVSSPLTLLRNRFSKATLQSSTPVKLQHKLNTAEDEIEVQNVSGISVHEEIAKSDKEPTEHNTSSNEKNNVTVGEESQEMELNSDIATPTLVGADSGEKEFKEVSLKCEKTCGMVQTSEQSDIKITETPLQPAIGDPMAKNKRCIVM